MKSYYQEKFGSMFYIIKIGNNMGRRMWKVRLSVLHVEKTCPFSDCRDSKNRLWFYIYIGEPFFYVLPRTQVQILLFPSIRALWKCFYLVSCLCLRETVLYDSFIIFVVLFSAKFNVVILLESTTLYMDLQVNCFRLSDCFFWKSW